MAEREEVGKVKLSRVRLSFAHLLHAQEGKPDKQTGRTPDPRYNCSLLIPKNGDEVQKNNLKLLKAAKEAVMAGKWPKGDVRLKPEKLCTRDGDQENYDGYEGMYFVSCGSSQDRPPQIIDNRKDSDGKWQRLAGENANGERIWLNGGAQKIYSGCYVNAIVRLWAQDNEHGKRVNATIEIVQFYSHGDAFGASRADADEEFDENDVGEVDEIGDDGDDGSDMI